MHRLLLLCVGLLIAVLLSACGGSAGTVGIATGKALFSNAPAGVTLAPGAAATYAVGGGTPIYSVNTSNRDVATATVSGTSLTITAVGSGSAAIQLTDAVGASISIPVTVSAGPVTPIPTPAPLFMTAPSALTLALGASGSYMAGGGKRPYAISSSNASVARASINADTFLITGMAAGSAQVLITDADGASLPVTVTVGSGAVLTPLFSTAPDDVGLTVNTATTYTVGGGAGGYSATSANAGMVSVTLSGTSLTVTAVSAGTTNLLVSDSAGATLTIGVTVSALATPVIDILPGSATGNVGDVLQFIVNGGAPGYTITINNTSIATAAPVSVAASGGTFSVRLLNVGTTQATIVDARGQSSSLPITVGALSTVLRMSPSALLVGENSTEVIDLNIFGGTGPYRVLTSDLRLSNVTVTGSILSIGLGQNGNRCIASTSEAGTYVPSGTYDVTLTAIDSLGASATSIMTIKDNGLGLNLACP